MTAGISIGAAAKEARCPVETVRFYEREGLLPPALRTDGGHRLYTPEHRRRLRFVRRARELGFPLERVKALLRLADTSAAPCSQARGLAEIHLREVQEKLADLRRMERALTGIVGQCGAAGTGCALIETLFDEDGPGGPCG